MPNRSDQASSPARPSVVSGLAACAPQRLNSHRSVVPYNPGLYDLVEGRRRWDHPLTEADRARGFLGWHQRGYLPHFDAPGAVQFVTFRLHDCFPTSLRSEWEGLLTIEDRREQRMRLEEYLDKGRGEALLRRPELARLVAESLQHFDGERYELLAWVVMPNHVHALVVQTVTPLGEVVGGWKSFTAKAANRLLGRTGTFWQADYWDAFMRDGEQEAKARRYVASNPAKAHLIRPGETWPWAGARASGPLTANEVADTPRKPRPPRRQ